MSNNTPVCVPSLEENRDIVYPILCRPDNNNQLYKKMLEILEEDSILEEEYPDFGPVYRIVDYFTPFLI